MCVCTLCLLKCEKRSDWSYLACDSNEEVDHGVCMLFLHRLGEHGLCARHRLAAAKNLRHTYRRFIINTPDHLSIQGILQKAYKLFKHSVAEILRESIICQ